jgi:hypothetical protein
MKAESATAISRIGRITTKLVSAHTYGRDRSTTLCSGFAAMFVRRVLLDTSIQAIRRPGSFIVPRIQRRLASKAAYVCSRVGNNLAHSANHWIVYSVVLTQDRGAGALRLNHAGNCRKCAHCLGIWKPHIDTAPRAERHQGT